MHLRSKVQATRRMPPRAVLYGEQGRKRCPQAAWRRSPAFSTGERIKGRRAWRRNRNGRPFRAQLKISYTATRKTATRWLEFSSGGDLYTAVGELSDVNVGEDVTLHGRFVTHPSFGEQFRVEACEVRMPESATAIRRYLASGALPYIGKALAGRIVDVFGADALEGHRQRSHGADEDQGHHAGKGSGGFQRIQAYLRRAGGHRISGAI